jgi:bifunctional DNA-binding transcriptional regulator/antitoxin component of YhaV-PrlF toxin-antitoxin module
MLARWAFERFRAVASELSVEQASVRAGAIIAPTDGGPPTTDIIFLVERLESLVAAGKKLPLTNNVVLDQAAVLELIDQLRVAVPDEVRQAKRITEEASRITERARDEGDAIIARAQEQAAQMLEERELVRMSQQRAGEILDGANHEAAEVRRGADEYAAGVLIRLEGECIKALTSIKRGIDMLDERHRVPRQSGDGTGSLAVEPEATEAATRP